MTMKKIRNNPNIFLFVMGLFAGVLLFGVFFGSKHPQIFFWGVLIVWSMIMSLYVFTTIKDMAIFIGGILILYAYMYFIDTFILCSLNGFAHLTGEVLLGAPIYAYIARHFIKMCQKRQMMDKEMMDKK